MNLRGFSESGQSRPSSFFIEDILFAKPKALPVTREHSGVAPPLPTLPRPATFPEYGYACLGGPAFYPHPLLAHAAASTFFPKQGSEHPAFFIPASGTFLSPLYSLTW